MTVTFYFNVLQGWPEVVIRWCGWHNTRAGFWYILITKVHNTAVTVHGELTDVTSHTMYHSTIWLVWLPSLSTQNCMLPHASGGLLEHYRCNSVEDRADLAYFTQQQVHINCVKLFFHKRLQPIVALGQVRWEVHVIQCTVETDCSGKHGHQKLVLHLVGKLHCLEGWHY